MGLDRGMRAGMGARLALIFAASAAAPAVTAGAEEINATLNSTGGVVKCASKASSATQRYAMQIEYKAADLGHGWILNKWVAGSFLVSEFQVSGPQRGTTYSVEFADKTSRAYLFSDWFFNPVIIPDQEILLKQGEWEVESLMAAIRFGTPFYGPVSFKFQRLEERTGPEYPPGTKVVTFSTGMTCEYVPPPEPAPKPFVCPYKPAVNPANVPFENRGFGVQFWQSHWAKLPGESGYAEYLEAIDRMTCTNSNLIHLGINIALVDSPNGHVFSRETEISTSDERIKHFFKLLKDRSFKINAKPGFYHNGPGWNMTSFEPSNPEAFFAGWQEQLVHYAKLAQESGVDMFDISYEQSRITHRFAPQWRQLISAVRAVYNGTISANFQNIREAQHAVFLDQLDLVMTSIFYKHTALGNKNPTLAELTASWTDTERMPDWNPAEDSPAYTGISSGKSIFQELVSLHNISGKPILIGDIAFTSSDGAAGENNASLGIVDMQEQCDQFQAFFKAFTTSPQIGSWFKGVTFLHWFPFDWRKKDYRNYEIGPSGRAIRDKPSEKLVIDWYSGLGPANAPVCPTPLW